LLEVEKMKYLCHARSKSQEYGVHVTYGYLSILCGTKVWGACELRGACYLGVVDVE